MVRNHLENEKTCFSLKTQLFQHLVTVVWISQSSKLNNSLKSNHF